MILTTSTEKHPFSRTHLWGSATLLEMIRFTLMFKEFLPQVPAAYLGPCQRTMMEHLFLKNS